MKGKRRYRTKRNPETISNEVRHTKPHSPKVVRKNIRNDEVIGAVEEDGVHGGIDEMKAIATCALLLFWPTVAVMAIVMMLHATRMRLPSPVQHFQITK